MPLGATMGAASIGGSLLSSNAASSASQQQYSADMQGLAQQKSMFQTAQNALNPYITAGQSVLPTIQSLLTPGTAASTLQSLPGFQFQSQWGSQAATNQLTAEGLGGSAGPLGKALSDYNNGLAGTSYNNYVSQLQGFANMGSSAGGALAGDAISSGNSQASSSQAAGNALASGTLGSASALSGGLSGASNSLLLSQILNKSGSGSGGLFSNIGVTTPPGGWA